MNEREQQSTINVNTTRYSNAVLATRSEERGMSKLNNVKVALQSPECIGVYQKQSRSTVAAKVNKFFKEKRLAELKNEQHIMKVRSSMIKEGIDPRRFWPTDSSDSESELDEAPNLIVPDLIVTDTTRKATRTSSVKIVEDTTPEDIPDWSCGLQAYDLGVNPEIEERLRFPRQMNLDYTKNVTKKYTNKDKDSRRKSPGYSSRMSTFSSRRQSPFGNLSPQVLPQARKSCSSSTLLSQSFESGKFGFVHTIANQSEAMRANHTTKMPWLEECLEVSSRSCRFGLPMDVFELEQMTPLDYLLRFCRIPTDRQKFYTKCYNKGLMKVPEGKHESLKPLLLSCLKRVFSESVDAKDLDMFFVLVGGAVYRKPVDIRTFSVLSALAERILYVSYVNMKELAKYLRPRSFLEEADFSRFRWKIDKVQFSSHHLKILLFSLG